MNQNLSRSDYDKIKWSFIVTAESVVNSWRVWNRAIDISQDVLESQMSAVTS